MALISFKPNKGEAVLTDQKKIKCFQELMFSAWCPNFRQLLFTQTRKTPA
jgi:hypothetical protein